MHSQAIMLGPCSMCLVSYLNVWSEPHLLVVVPLFACIVVSLAYVIGKLPTFFSVAFHPGYAGMTFPIAVGLLATSGAASAFQTAGLPDVAWTVQQLAGIQLLLTTVIVCVVAARFLGLFVAGVKRDRAEGKLDSDQMAALCALRAYLSRGSKDVADAEAATDFVPTAAGIACDLDCEEPALAS